MTTCKNFNELPYILTLEGYKFDNCRNQSADSTINLVDRTFIDCTFTKCDFLQVNLTNTKFINCTLIDCDLYNTDISRTNLRGTVIKGKTRLPLEGLDTCNLPKKAHLY